jgi:hypothetical protein
MKSALFKITRIERENRASGSQNLKPEVAVIPRSFKFKKSFV